MALFKRKFLRKISPTQLIVGYASSGLPWPLRWILATRTVSRIVFFLVPVLLTIGVLTLDWSNGWPTFSYNRERATAIKEKASGIVKEVGEHIPDGVTERITETIRERIPDSIAVRRWAGEEITTRPPAMSTAPWRTSSAESSPPVSSSTIRIASFNIQVFGTSKAGKPDVMQVLADVVRKFDIVAIQELRTTDDSVLEYFLSLINSQGGAYRYVVGPRLGRTTSKEQYVFVYDAARIDVDPQSIITVADPQDHLHREPTIALCQVRTDGLQPGFSFLLANIHTDPDETDTELDALADVFVALQTNGWREDDVILLGDLNVNYKKLGRLGQLPNIAYTVHGEPTNTRGTSSYDNIVFNNLATTEFMGNSGIVNLQREYGLSMDKALEVSDHLPIWAEFDMFEHGVNVPLASRPNVAPIGTGQGRLVENPLLRLRGLQR
ncbi:MAG: endonuclease/exonuclease/phosphatase family protein [Planctomycetaceae bacterium]|nr:endonuclease/exonuclease/phosphatase family protein [Planctomycetales bacterium]MCB9927594.1 endonuclease/exonuclease/phosphatase family protein [Planctomycetaceae bacterium]